jgi:GT2 family glycosyltransferase
MPAAPVSVVIVTRNRRRELLATIRRLEQLPQDPPIIVVDNDSRDGTADHVVRHHPHVSVIRLDRNAGAAGRNIGVEHARTPFVAFSDDDSWWASDALTIAADLFERHDRLGLVAAKVLVGAQEITDPTSIAMAHSPLHTEPDLPGPSVLGFLACGAVVRRSAFLGARGFPSWGVGGEEAPLALALAGDGWGLAYVARVIAHHHPSLDRDPVSRRRNEMRNELWTRWSRLPLGVATVETARTLCAVLRDRTTAGAALAAVWGAPTVLRSRRPVPHAVAHDWQVLQRRAHG